MIRKCSKMLWGLPLLCMALSGSLKAQVGQAVKPGAPVFPEMAPKIENFDRSAFWAREYALRHLVMILASDQMEGRLTGSVQDSMAAMFIGKEFLQCGLLPLDKDSVGKTQTDYWQDYEFDARWGEHVRTRNVVGVVKGTHPELNKRYVVVGAHYDHLGWGDKVENSMRKGVKAIHNGADDNASGVAMMIELMRYFSLYPTQKSLVFVAFSGEEVGMCGSRAFLDKFPYGRQNIDAMFNLDMLGGLSGDEFKVNGVGTSAEAADMVKKASEISDLKISTSQAGHGPSDHALFYAEKIPVFFFCTMPTKNYHTPDDDPNTLNYPGMVRISGLIGNLLSQVGNSAPLTFRSTGEPSQPTMGMGKFKATLGLMPDINSSGDEGLTAMIVVEGKPAYKAGIRSGDIILSLDGTEVSDIDQYMKKLATFEKGQRVKVKVKMKQSGKIKVFKVKL